LDLNNIIGFGPRFYREQMGIGRFKSFVVAYKDSDLWIGVDNVSFNPSMVEFTTNKLIEIRTTLESFITTYPLFSTSYSPIKLPEICPEIASIMGEAASVAGTGPMAAVAGAFSEYIGKAIQQEYAINEIVVENGGDIYLYLKSDLIFSVYAGNSNLSGKIGVKIPYDFTPLGICTSAGKVGPSVSFGKADAVVVACKNTALADAYATAFGNIVSTGSDISLAIEKAKICTEIKSILIICENKVGVYGQFDLSPIA